MKEFKTDALVLRSRPLGESDRLLTLLSRERGKISAVARGSRKTKSKLASGVDLFTHGHFVMYQGRTLATIIQQEVRERFTHLTRDPLVYSYALYFVELVDRILVEEEKNKDIFNLLAEAWNCLQEERDFFLLARAFELKILLLLGYNPNLNGCVTCGRKEINSLSLKHGGLLCVACAETEHTIPFSAGAVSLSRFLLNRSLKGSRTARGASKQKEEICRLTTGFINYHLDLRNFKTLQYINSLEQHAGE